MSVLTKEELYGVIGSRFGNLVVVAYGGRIKRYHNYICRCECGSGKYFLVGRCQVVGGRPISCGCARDARIGMLNKTHGKSRTSEYGIYLQMIARCHDPESKAYEYYGGRGISVCDRWRDSFEYFLKDMGDRPPGFSLDRVDNDGDYKPENVRWATRKTQARNRRSNHILKFNDREQPLAAWSEELGISSWVIQNRLKDGWSVDRALSTPVRAMAKWRVSSALGA